MTPEEREKASAVLNIIWLICFIGKGLFWLLVAYVVIHFIGKVW